MGNKGTNRRGISCGRMGRTGGTGPVILFAMAALLLLLGGIALITPEKNPAMTSSGGGGADPQALPTCWIVSPEDGGVVAGQMEVIVGYRAREVIPGHPTGVVKKVELWLGDSLVAAQQIIPPQKEGEVLLLVDTTILQDGDHDFTAQACYDGHCGWSDVVTLRIDNSPPDIPLLQLRYGASNALTVEWIAPADWVDGTAYAVAGQELKYSDQPFAWEDGNTLWVGPPKEPGETDETTVTGLSPESWFYFTLKVWDEIGNEVMSQQLATQTMAEGVQHLSGSVGVDTVLFGGCTYYVTGAYTVAPGVTLTIEEGAVLKLNDGAVIGVEDASASIIMEGTVAQPVVITSASDNSAGESLEGQTGIPEPGDHGGVVLNQECYVNEARIRYGETGILTYVLRPTVNGQEVWE